VELVADESCAVPVIRALRAAGHDVLAIGESAMGASDEAVSARALSERRVLITEDRDFGELVYAARAFGGGCDVRQVHEPRVRRKAGGGSRGIGQTGSAAAGRLHGRRTRAGARGAPTATRVRLLSPLRKSNAFSGRFECLRSKVWTRCSQSRLLS
jgi:Domain of unknown function (DUF5615)